MKGASFFYRLLICFKKVKIRTFFEFDLVKGQEFQYTDHSIEHDDEARRLYSLWMDCIDKGEQSILREDLKMAEKYGAQAMVWAELFWYRVLEVTDMFDCPQVMVITRDWKIGFTKQKKSKNLYNVLDEIESLPRATVPLFSQN
jgi:hypothetical protein